MPKALGREAQGGFLLLFVATPIDGNDQTDERWGRTLLAVQNHGKTSFLPGRSLSHHSLWVLSCLLPAPSAGCPHQGHPRALLGSAPSRGRWAQGGTKRGTQTTHRARAQSGEPKPRTEGWERHGRGRCHPHDEIRDEARSPLGAET